MKKSRPCAVIWCSHSVRSLTACFGGAGFSVFHGLITVPIHIVSACYIVIGTIREGVPRGGTTHQYCYHQQTESDFVEYGYFLLQCLFF